MANTLTKPYELATLFSGKQIKVRPRSWFIQNGWKDEQGCEPACYHEPTDTVYVTQKLFDEIKEMDLNGRTISTFV